MAARTRKALGYFELTIVILLVFAALFFVFVARGKRKLVAVRPWTSVILLVWRSRRRQIERNISLLRPDLSRREVRRMAKEVAYRIAIDSIFVICYWDEELFEGAIEIGPGMFEVASQHQEGRAVVLFADHCGEFDGAGPAIARLGLNNFTAVVEFIQVVGRLFDHSRRHWGADLIHIRGGTSEKAMERLAAGHVVMVLTDIFRRPRGESDEIVCQAGNAVVNVATLPARLARQAWADGGAVYTLEFGWNIERQVLRVDAAPFEFPWTADETEDVRAATRFLGERVMEKIRSNPGAWMQAATLQLTHG